MEKLYLYLARRDKKGIKILTINKGQCLPTRLTDLTVLGLPHNSLTELHNIVYENRMEWELWAESSPSYHDFRERLAKRGYTNIPNADTPGVRMEMKPINVSTQGIKSLPGQRTMMKRNSR